MKFNNKKKHTKVYPKTDIKIITWTLKNYKFKLWKTLFTQLKRKPQKNVLTKYIYDKGSYSKYTKISGTSNIIKSVSIWTPGQIKDTDSKSAYQNTQNHISLGNYKVKQQWSSTAHLLDPVSSKRGRGHGASLVAQW